MSILKRAQRESCTQMEDHGGTPYSPLAAPSQKFVRTLYRSRERTGGSTEKPLDSHSRHTGKSKSGSATPDSANIRLDGQKMKLTKVLSKTLID